MRNENPGNGSELSPVAVIAAFIGLVVAGFVGVQGMQPRVQIGSMLAFDDTSPRFMATHNQLGPSTDEIGAALPTSFLLHVDDGVSTGHTCLIDSRISPRLHGSLVINRVIKTDMTDILHARWVGQPTSTGNGCRDGQEVVLDVVQFDDLERLAGGVGPARNRS